MCETSEVSLYFMELLCASSFAVLLPSARTYSSNIQEPIYLPPCSKNECKTSIPQEMLGPGYKKQLYYLIKIIHQISVILIEIICILKGEWIFIQMIVLSVISPNIFIYILYKHFNVEHFILHS